MATVLAPLLWASALAGHSLSYASTAWLLSGLTPSPLLNALLPALSSLPALVPLPVRRSGYLLQLGAVLLLLAGSLGLFAPSPWWPLLAALLLAAGERISTVPLQHALQDRNGVRMERLRWSGDLGRWVGTVLTGVLFPLGRALLQYGHALVLLLPMLVVALRPVGRDIRARPAGDRQPPARRPGRRRGGLQPAALAQGALFGGLFALLALWVRQVGAGNCFDFGMVLSAYLLGRGLGPWLRRLAPVCCYLLMAALLLSTQVLPGWAAVALFLPFGALAASTDRSLAEPPGSGDPALAWDRLERSSAVGGLVGSLAMGALLQLTGLAMALPLQVGLFTLGALLSLRRPAPRAGYSAEEGR